MLYVMRRSLRSAWIAVVTFGFAVAGVGAEGPSLALDESQEPDAGNCVYESDAVAGMPTAKLGLPGGEQLHVHVAATGSDRAAGMQHLCAETIEDTAILFLFEQLRRPRFHMDNVHAPLDIVFLGRDGRIVEVHRMEPGQDTLTVPQKPVAGALEVAAGRGATHGLERGRVIQLPARYSDYGAFR